MIENIPSIRATFSAPVRKSVSVREKNDSGAFDEKWRVSKTTISLSFCQESDTPKQYEKRNCVKTREIVSNHELHELHEFIIN